MADPVQLLIEQLCDYFDKSEIDIQAVQRLMTEYHSDRCHWEPYYFEHPDRYTRNLVHTGNGRFNLLLVVWRPGQGSAIHDHAGSHCFLKVLQGELTETRYDWPIKDENDGAPRQIKQTALRTDSCSYMHDKIGLHKVVNNHPSITAASLHLYIPPYDRCQCFDADTGAPHEAVISFYSSEGKIVFEKPPSAY